MREGEFRRPGWEGEYLDDPLDRDDLALVDDGDEGVEVDGPTYRACFEHEPEPDESRARRRSFRGSRRFRADLDE